MTKSLSRTRQQESSIQGVTLRGSSVWRVNTSCPVKGSCFAICCTSSCVRTTSFSRRREKKNVFLFTECIAMLPLPGFSLLVLTQWKRRLQGNSKIHFLIFNAMSSLVYRFHPASATYLHPSTATT